MLCTFGFSGFKMYGLACVFKRQRYFEGTLFEILFDNRFLSCQIGEPNAIVTR